MRLERELGVARELVRGAGRIILEKRDDLEVKMKSREEYVSSADYASSDFLQRGLRAEFPDYGILDEESEVDGRDKKYCFVVDPLDGTWGYVKGHDEFGVLLGLLEDGVPVLGVVYRPVQDELIWGVKGEGAFFENGERLAVGDNCLDDILVSASRDNAFFDFLKGKGYDPVKMPTSYKINAVAKGDYTSFICHPDSVMGLWDFCAHQVILEEAGGVLTDFFGEKIDYMGDRLNKKGAIATHREKLGELVNLDKYRG